MGSSGPARRERLEEFQSNCGTSADGMCGPDTVRTLTVMSSQTGAGPGIAAVRERERLRDRPRINRRVSHRRRSIRRSQRPDQDTLA